MHDHCSGDMLALFCKPCAAQLVHLRALFDSTEFCSCGGVTECAAWSRLPRIRSAQEHLRWTRAVPSTLPPGLQAGLRVQDQAAATRPQVMGDPHASCFGHERSTYRIAPLAGQHGAPRFSSPSGEQLSGSSQWLSSELPRLNKRVPSNPVAASEEIWVEPTPR